jgi:hypothetical protein
MNSTSEFSGSGKSQVPPDEALHTLHSGVARVDVERALAYEQLATFRMAKRNLIERHKKMLAHKLGEDDPRVVALEARRAAMEGELRDLDVARAQAAISIPDVEPAGYAVHGFVRSPVRMPIPDLTVALYDANGRIRGDFKPAATDKDGYFQLITNSLIPSGEILDKHEKQAASVHLELRIFDARRKELAHDTPSLEALQGQVEFRDVRVDSNTGAGSSAPPGARKKPPVTSRSSETPRSLLQIINEGLRASRRPPHVSGKKSPKSAPKKTRGRKPQQRRRKKRP